MEFTMKTLTDNVTTIVTAAIGWIEKFVALIVSQPLLLAFVIVSFVGLAVGLIARLIRL